ncbi:MAG: hypothetical protein HYZ34_15015, partial [Ignavibacteriae bacterium]|nr:hypothetical protein [Ignavibacteriota bacterium]
MKHVFSILFVYLLTVCQVMYAQIERLTVDDGLSQNFIFKIFQDSRGFIWIGTKDGLNRYDGNNFVVYRHDPFDSTSLSDNEVTEIIEDRNGVLWIGTNDGGLNCFDRATERFTRYTAIINDSLSLNQFIIARICEGKNHVLWVATNTGLIKFDKSKGVSEFFPPQQDDSLHLRRQGIYNVYENRDGVLWLTSTESGLVRMDVWNQPIRQHRSIYQASGQEQIIKTFKYHEQTRALYLLTSSNVVVMNATTNLFRTLINDEHDTTNFIGGSLEEVGPNLYIGVRYNLFEFDIYNKVKKNIINIPEGYFTSLFRDISGTLWLGTNGSGVYKYVPRANRFHHSEGSFLRTLFERELAACRRLDINLEPALSGRAAWFPAMLKDSKGNFWVVSSGVTKLDASMSKVKKFPSPMLPDSIMSNGVMDILLEDNAGTVWLGAPKGIGYFDRTDKFQYVRLYPAVNQFNVTGIQNFDYKDITCIYQDKKGTFWLGTPVLGLIRFEPSTNNIRYFQQQRSNPKSISNNHVLTICEDPNG